MEELSGCWREAQRCDRAATELLRIRRDLSLDFFDHITDLLREVESTSRLLRDLHDLFPIYQSRVPIVLYYLTVVLPCLQKTLRDMMIYIDNDALPSTSQWILMNERLSEEGGMALAARFVMYIEFLVQLVRLLSRTASYENLEIEALERHTRYALLPLAVLAESKLYNMDQSLIQSHSLAPPVPVQPHLAPTKPNPQDIERRHWAERVFESQPHSTTGLRHKRASRCFGPPMVEQRLGIPQGSTVLFKLPFDKNRLSVTLYLHPEGADITRLLCRWMDRLNNPMYSCYGVHELCVRRSGSSLQFRRWSRNKGDSKVWMALFFKTWERMVLFHASFVALKSRCPLTVTVNSDDFRLSGEKRLFQEAIIDDGFEHSLAVYQDDKNGGLRLHAAVWQGELRRCPVWTAFVTYQAASPEWLVRRSHHRFWIKDIQPYVFCKNYKVRHQIRKGGEFEIYFVSTRAADEFEEVFGLGSDTGSLEGGPEERGG